ncbi:MAG TPA: helix-turn-helix domain-containing protein [Acidimicrobiia bacterium]|nr:helix-turn-helix domain-containing protein [Acidimicrobiia bacterium]
MSDFSGKALIAAGRMIRARRRQLGMSQEEASTRADISVGTWSLLERGMHRPKVETAANVAAALEWEPARLNFIVVQKEDDAEKMREFGERVRARRRELGLSRQEAAEIAHVSISGWQHIERGRIRPRPHTARRIAETLNWPIEEFEALRDRPMPPATIPGLSAEQTQKLIAFGERIRNARKEMELTQIVAAKRAGLSNATWSPLERGRVRPILTTMLKVCTFFDWDYHDYVDLVAPNSGPSMEFLENQMKYAENHSGLGPFIQAHISFNGVSYYTPAPSPIPSMVDHEHPRAANE